MSPMPDSPMRSVSRWCLWVLLPMLTVAGFPQHSAVAAERLQAPPGYQMAVQHGTTDFSCPKTPPPYTGEMNFPSKYEGSGKARDQLNPEADARRRQQIEGIRTLEKGVAKMVGVYMRTGEPAALACTLSWLSTWSDAHALEGEGSTHQGRSMRKWALASVSGAYAHLKFSSSAPLATTASAEQARRIEAWLGRVADLVKAEWRTDDPDNDSKINNHYYWAAWSGMATAVVLDRRDLFDWSLGIYRIFADQVDADGYLPYELARDTRALAYHNYALTPVVMIAAFAKANGVDAAGEGKAALSRLAALDLRGIDNPKLFEQKTGHAQNLEDLKDSDTLAWLAPYCWTVQCSEEWTQRLQRLGRQSNDRLGGDLSGVFVRAAP